MLSLATGPLRCNTDTDSSVIDVTDAVAVAKGLGPRIYVGGVSTAISQTMIRNHFSQYGKVVDVYFPRHQTTGQRQAFCFVTFTTRKAANTSVSNSNRVIHGHQVGSIAHTTDRLTHYRASATEKEPLGLSDSLVDSGALSTAQQALAMAKLNGVQSCFVRTHTSNSTQTLPENQLARTQLESPGTSGYMFGMPPLTPAAILATLSQSSFSGRTPASAPQHSTGVLTSMLQAYLQATAPSTVVAPLSCPQMPYQQINNVPLHCEEAIMWRRLQNL